VRDGSVVFSLLGLRVLRNFIVVIRFAVEVVSFVGNSDTVRSLGKVVDDLAIKVEVLENSSLGRHHLIDLVVKSLIFQNISKSLVVGAVLVSHFG